MIVFPKKMFVAYIESDSEDILNLPTCSAGYTEQHRKEIERRMERSVQNRKRIYPHHDWKYKIERVGTKPINNLRVARIDYSYWYLSNGKYLIRVPLKVIQDVVMNVGIQKDGRIDADFVWVRNHAHLQLVRVGSEIHQRALATINLQNLKPLKKNELKVGGEYVTRSGTPGVFLGFVKGRNFNRWSGRFSNGKRIPILGGKFSKRMLWFRGSKKEFETWLAKSPRGQPYLLKIQENHSYVKRRSETEIPLDLIDQIRNEARQATGNGSWKDVRSTIRKAEEDQEPLYPIGLENYDQVMKRSGKIIPTQQLLK